MFYSHSCDSLPWQSVHPIKVHQGNACHHGDRLRGHQGIVGYVSPAAYRQSAIADRWESGFICFSLELPSTSFYGSPSFPFALVFSSTDGRYLLFLCHNFLMWKMLKNIKLWVLFILLVFFWLLDYLYPPFNLGNLGKQKDERPNAVIANKADIHLSFFFE